MSMIGLRSTSLLRSFVFSGIAHACRRRTAPRDIPNVPRLISYSRYLNATLSTASFKQPPHHASVLVYSPSKETLEDAELDVELTPPEQALINITDRAAEQLRSIANRENDPNAALRISIESGGCHGYQYAMELTSERQSDDYQFTHPGLKPCNVLVDAVSLPLLKGSTLDFATELIGSSFRVENNPQSKGSGCGCGVSWELNI